MKSLYKHILIGMSVIALLLLPSCDMLIYDNCESCGVDGANVYMTFQMNFNSDKPITKAQGDNPSIDADADDWEDYVDNLAVLVFQTGTNGVKVVDEYTTASFFTMKMKPGTYDFYFIANYPAADLNAIMAKTKQEIETYINTSLEFHSFQGATSPNPLFPMARIYRAQTVSEGGTYANPLPFKPNVGSIAANQLKPVSSFGTDWQSAQYQNTVNLVRANAKIELIIDGDGKGDIAKVEYINAAKNYTFSELSTIPSSQLLATAQLFALTTDAVTNKLKGKIYTPERLFAASETKGWDVVNDVPLGSVSYIKVTMTGGKVYKIPVISNSPSSMSGVNYFSVARDNTKADYNIIRNHHYQFNLNIPADGKEIELTLQVMPWTLVESHMNYTRPVYTIQLLKGATEYKNIKAEIELPDNVQPSTLEIRFNITEPVGALWTATITNGLEFELIAGPGSATHGIVQTGGAEQTFFITPRSLFESVPRYTQFYITVDGKELFLGFKEDGLGGFLETDCRYLGDGTPYRWQIKQTMGI